ncbi:hypothetical protein BH23GEM7_BH23GEM7_37870 [soil metagenome]
MERDDIYGRRSPDSPPSGADEPPILVSERAPRPPEDPRFEAVPRREGDERARRDPSAIRTEDTEPYIALQYVARLFKVAAMVVVVALAAEMVAGVALEGAGALIPLMAEVIRGVVLAAILWGAGDLTLLLIDVGHDVRAARVLLGRLSARASSDVLPRKEREREG